MTLSAMFRGCSRNTQGTCTVAQQYLFFSKKKSIREYTVTHSHTQSHTVTHRHTCDIQLIHQSQKHWPGVAWQPVDHLLYQTCRYLPPQCSHHILLQSTWARASVSTWPATAAMPALPSQRGTDTPYTTQSVRPGQGAVGAAFLFR